MKMAKVKARKRKKPFREDIIILSFLTIMLFTMFVTDASNEPEDFYAPMDPPPPKNGDTPSEPELLEETLLERSGYTTESTSTEEDFEVQWESVVEMTIVLTWSDDYGNNDEFDVSLQYEGDEIERASDTSGRIEFTTTDNPPGNYTVVITAINCPGLVNTPIGVLDGGNDWDLEVSIKREVVEDE
jgi:hypothetical protein